MSAATASLPNDLELPAAEPMAFTFQLRFPTEADARVCASRLAPRTAETCVFVDGIGRWFVSASVWLEPTADHLQRTAETLRGAAAAHGGEFVGWKDEKPSRDQAVGGDAGLSGTGDSDSIIAADKLAEAIEQYQSEHWLDAAVLLEPIIGVDQEVDELAGPLLGLAQLKLGQPELACQTLAQALSHLDPQRVDPTALEEARLNYGVALTRSGYPEKAIVIYEQILAANPKSGAAAYNLACCHALCRQLEQSLKALQRAITTDRDYLQQALHDPDFENVRAMGGFWQFVEGQRRWTIFRLFSLAH